MIGTGTHGYAVDRRIGAEDGDRGALREVVGTSGRNAHLETVYGEPVESNGETVVPAASVSYGFGGGRGLGQEDATGEKSEDGYGGGVSAKPVEVLEIDEDGALRPVLRVRAGSRTSHVDVLIGLELSGDSDGDPTGVRQVRRGLRLPRADQGVPTCSWRR